MATWVKTREDAMALDLDHHEMAALRLLLEDAVELADRGMWPAADPDLAKERLASTATATTPKQAVAAVRRLSKTLG